MLQKKSAWKLLQRLAEKLLQRLAKKNVANCVQKLAEKLLQSLAKKNVAKFGREKFGRKMLQKSGGEIVSKFEPVSSQPMGKITKIRPYCNKSNLEKVTKFKPVSL